MKNELKSHAAFSEILSDFKVSDKTLAILKESRLLLLSSPSAVGRNTVIKHLVHTNKYHFIVSDTTRKPRSNDGIMEQNGKEYWFVSEEEFLEGLRNGQYVEAAIIHNQQVSGISVKQLKHSIKENKIAVTDIEVQGVKKIMRLKPDTTAIFMLPPSFSEWMRRFNQRGQLHNDERKNRLTSALSEFTDAINSGYFTYLINHNVPQTVDAINRIMMTKSVDLNEQKQGEKLIKQLYRETEEELKKIS